MKEKYVEERFPRYFEFGVHGDGRVDLATSEDSTRATVSKEHAANLLKDRNEAIDMLVILALRFAETNPEEFNKVWGYWP